MTSTFQQTTSQTYSKSSGSLPLEGQQGILSGQSVNQSQASLGYGQNVSTLAQPSLGGSSYQSGMDSSLQSGMSSSSLQTDTLQQSNLGSSQFGQSERISMPLVEEQLEIRKGIREGGMGALNIRKEVQEQAVAVNVPVSRETVTVERVPAMGNTNIPNDAFQTREFTIPTREETIEVIKKPVVREEVQIRKDLIEENRVVQDTLRREDIVAANVSNVNLGSGFNSSGISSSQSMSSMGSSSYGSTY